jgi:uncharacterized repeat protein (TIGR03803 family)
MRIEFVTRTLVAIIAIGLATPAVAHDKILSLDEFQPAQNYPGGGNPQGPVITDSHGTVYGTTEFGGGNGCSGVGCGTIYALSPPAKGSKQWTFQILYSFTDGEDGRYPTTALALGPNGSLFGYAYGTTDGSVFQLSPPSQQGQPWTFQTLYVFQGGSDGSLPEGTPIWDGQSLYGTAYGGSGVCGQFGCGLVFQLTPPAQGNGAWTKTTVFAFPGGPDGGEPGSIAGVDSNGALYVSTLLGNGAVYQLSPPNGGGQWTETQLTSFNGGNDGTRPANLMLSPDGTVYGLADNVSAGLAFEITPPNGNVGWKRTNIADIAQKGQAGTYGPDSLVAGPNGTLVGAIFGDVDAFPGAVFQLSPPRSGKKWTYSELANFNHGPDRNPVSVVAGLDGHLFGVLNGGDSGPGGLFEVR